MQGVGLEVADHLEPFLGDRRAGTRLHEFSRSLDLAGITGISGFVR
jgi:hypothetical protein